MNLQILKLLLSSRDTHSRYGKFVKECVDQEDSKELKLICNAIDRLYDEHDSVSFSVDDLDIMLSKAYPNQPKTLIEPILERLKNESANETLLSDYLEELRTRKAAHQIAIHALQVYETGKGIETLTDAFNNLQDGLPNGIQDGEDDEFVSNDIAELLTELEQEPGLNWRLKTLNEMLGPLRKGNFMFLFARPECFTPDTEVLTPRGWLSVDKVTYDTEISAVDKQYRVRFEKPAMVTKREDFTEVYKFSNKRGQLDLVVSPGHRMVYTVNGEWQEATAKNVLFYQGRKVHTAALAGGSGVEWTAQDALHVAYQADGRTRVYETNGYRSSNHMYGYEIHVKEERKVYRLTQLLEQSCLNYTKWVDAKGYTGFYIKTDVVFTKDFSTITLEDKDALWCKQFANELKFWDGTIRANTRWTYSNNNKEAVDKAQAIAALAGYNTFLGVHINKEPYAPTYVLTIRSAYVPVDGQSIVKEVLPNTESLYCFSVSTGMLLVRHNGKVAICGNCGKTTFLASETSFMLEQLDRPLLWVNNEEESRKVVQRVVQASLGVTDEQLMHNKERCNELFQKRTGGRFKINKGGATTKRGIEQWCKQLNPGLIVLDQIDKIQGFEDERHDLKLKQVYGWARELAKEYGPVIAVCQAGGTGENKKWLTMNDVDSSHTAKQGEADVVLGIGKLHDEQYERVRFLHASKNKLTGIHGKKEVLINVALARYEDLR